MLTVTTPATDMTLLTVLERRAAVGVADGSKDAELEAMEARVAAAIAGACGVARNGAVPPTLRLEILTDTYRLKTSQDVLILSRRPVVSITSVTENSTLLDGSLDYVVEESAGLLRRLSGDAFVYWPSGKTVVVYPAGWATVPPDLKLAASKLMLSYWTEGGREPGLRSEDIPGVYSASYQDKESDNPAIPSDVMQILEAGGYINRWLA